MHAIHQIDQFIEAHSDLVDVPTDLWYYRFVKHVPSGRIAKLHFNGDTITTMTIDGEGGTETYEWNSVEAFMYLKANIKPSKWRRMYD